MSEHRNPRRKIRRSCRDSGLEGYALQRLQLMSVLAEAKLPDGTPGKREHAPLKLARIRWFIWRLDDRLGLPLTDFGDELVVHPHDRENRPVGV